MKQRILFLAIFIGVYVLMTSCKMNSTDREYVGKWYKKVTEVDKEIEAVENWVDVKKVRLERDTRVSHKHHIAEDSSWTWIIGRASIMREDRFQNRDTTVTKDVFYQLFVLDESYYFKDHPGVRVGKIHNESQGKIYLEIIDGDWVRNFERSDKAIYSWKKTSERWTIDKQIEEELKKATSDSSQKINPSEDLMDKVNSYIKKVWL